MAGHVNHEDMKNEKWASTASGDKGSRWSVFFPRQMTCGLNVQLEQLGNSELRFVSLFRFMGSLEFRDGILGLQSYIVGISRWGGRVY